MTKEEKNPFLELQQGIKTANFQEYIIQAQYKNNNGNELYVRSINIDKSLITSQINAEILDKLTNVKYSKNTLTVFLVLMKKLKPDSDIVILNTNEICEATKYKKSSINKAIQDLISLELISKIKGRNNTYKYFINPLII
jgi:DNA-binding MarR family transcriptional regulator